MQLIGWESSPKTDYKLNTDGAFSNATKTAGIGAFIRNRDGEFIAALAANIGEVSNVTVELWAIHTTYPSKKNEYQKITSKN